MLKPLYPAQIHLKILLSRVKEVCLLIMKETKVAFAAGTGGWTFLSCFVLFCLVTGQKSCDHLKLKTSQAVKPDGQTVSNCQSSGFQRSDMILVLVFWNTKLCLLILNDTSKIRCQTVKWWSTDSAWFKILHFMSTIWSLFKVTKLSLFTFFFGTHWCRARIVYFALSIPASVFPGWNI